MKKANDNLISLFKEEGITIKKLADELGYNRATIRVRRNNPRTYSVDEIMSISVLLKKTPTAILKILLREIEHKADHQN